MLGLRTPLFLSFQLLEVTAIRRSLVYVPCSDRLFCFKFVVLTLLHPHCYLLAGSPPFSRLFGRIILVLAAQHKKEWTLIVSIGNTIPFDLGTCSGSPDLRLELASGEGLLFNG